MDKRGEILNRIINVLDSTAPDSELYLYGSHARGDNNNSSDWDLLILLNENKISFDYETQIMDDFYDIELEIGEIISPLVYSKTEWINKYFMTPFFQNIEREGIRLK